MKRNNKIKIFFMFMLVFFSFLFNFNATAVFDGYDFVFENYAQDVLNPSNKKTQKSKKGRKPKDEKIYNYNSGDVDCCAQNGAILMDVRTNDVLYAKTANLIAPMASTTKIMTAILAIENTKDIKKNFEVDEEAIKVQGSSMGLGRKDVVNMQGLIIGMMLSSGNDAANEIAVRVIKELIEENEIEPFEKKYEKSVKKHIAKFVELMNDKAKELGLKNTKFSSPSGLGPEDVVYSDKYKVNETTAKDLAILSSYAMKNKVFKKICSASKSSVRFKQIFDEDAQKYENDAKRWYVNHNKLLRKGSNQYYPFACGVKTGFTKEAGRCLVAAAEKDGVVLVAVVLNDKQDWDDCRKLLNYGFSKYSSFDLPDDFEIEDDVRYKEFKIIGAEGEDKFFKVEQEKPLSVRLTSNMKKNNKISCKIKANSIFFKIAPGETVGEVEYYLNDELICKTNLIAKDITKTKKDYES